MRSAVVHLPLGSAPFQILRREEDCERLPDYLCFLVSQDTLGAEIPTGDPSGEIDQENRIIPNRLDPDVEQIGNIIHLRVPGQDRTFGWC